MFSANPVIVIYFRKKKYFISNDFIFILTLVENIKTFDNLLHIEVGISYNSSFIMFFLLHRFSIIKEKKCKILASYYPYCTIYAIIIPHLVSCDMIEELNW